MNGLQEIATREHDLEEFNVKETYLEIFFDMFGTRTIGKCFDNFIEVFVDPFTKEVLDDLNMPTDFTQIMLYANDLLQDNAYIRENNMALYRIRSNEIVNAYMYKIITDQYLIYKNSSNSGHPIKVSVPKDKLIKSLLEDVLVEDTSVLNPVLEMERLGSVTYKGISGLNLSQAYKLEKRSYDESMLGLLALSSPVNANIGVTRQLTYDTNILSTRGIIKCGDKATNGKELSAANMLSPTELLLPFSSTHDDPRMWGLQCSDTLSKLL